MIYKKISVIVVVILAHSFCLAQDLIYAPGQFVIRVKGELYDECKKEISKSERYQLQFKVDQKNANFFKDNGIYQIQPMGYHDDTKKVVISESKKEGSFVFYTEEKEILPLIERLKKQENVVYVHPNYLFHSNASPDDKKYTNGDQWYIDQICMPGAWDIQKGCGMVNIAVLDAGFRNLKHNDIDDKFSLVKRDETDIIMSDYPSSQYSTISGEDYHFPDGNPDDGKSFHGLQVAGVAGAETNNNKGIAGIAWDNPIIPVRVGFAIKRYSQQIETFEYDDVERAIRWLINSNYPKPMVMNMSFGTAGTPSSFQDMEDALEEAVKKGIVVVCASGKNGSNQVPYPASSTYTIAVGATYKSDYRASFSDYGHNLDLVAPGVDIMTLKRTTINQYDAVDGTSFAAPIVSGVAALILSQNPNLNPEQVRKVLNGSADKVAGMNGQNFHNEYGFGRVNAEKSLLAVPQVQHYVTISNKTITTTQYVHAITQIQASNYTVNSGAEVEFKAGERIILSPNFTVKSEGDFHAHIGTVLAPCSNQKSGEEDDEKDSQDGDEKTTSTDLYEEEDPSTKEESTQNNKFENESVRSKNLQIYPNPVQDYFTVDFESNEKMKLVVYNSMGEKIYEEYVMNETTINTSLWSSGVYLVKIGDRTCNRVVKY